MTFNGPLDLVIYHFIEVRHQPGPGFFDQKGTIIADLCSSRNPKDGAVPDSELLQKGRSIRIDISGTNYPRFDVNPNIGERLGMSLLRILRLIFEAVNREHFSSNLRSNL